jgi:hypothetical protein
MHVRRALALASAVAAAAFAACKEPPFAPRWDSDMFMPLSTQPIRLSTYFTLGTIPPATSASVSFPAQQQSISGVLGTVLKNMVTEQARCTSTVNPALTCHMLKLTVAKTKPITATDTLFLANAQANLNAGGPGTVVFPISLATTDASKSDSVYLTTASVNMLQAAGKNSSPLWIQLRGQVANPGASPIAITGTDSLGITLSVTVRVATVHK